MRKTFLPALLLAGSALAGAGFAAAQGEEAPPPMDGGPGHHFFMHRPMPGEHLEGRLAFLKTELQIKATQQKAWDDFAAAAHQSVKVLTDARPPRPDDGGKKHQRGDWTPPPVPDRLDHAEKMMNARLTALHTIAGPAKALYATLDDTQKKTADELFLGPMGFH